MKARKKNYDLGMFNHGGPRTKSTYWGFDFEDLPMICISINNYPMIEVSTCCAINIALDFIATNLLLDTF